MAIRALSVCAGIGGLDIGWRLASGGRTVCYVERDAYAASVLVARMEAQTLDLAPIWSDLLTLPYHLLRGFVDGVIAGIPCQPYSAAGKGLGADDGRDLWPATFRILQKLGAQWLFLENVGRFASNPDGLRRVLKDLASMGWNAEWGVFSCGALGAPHRRERLFILAYSDRAILRSAVQKLGHSDIVAGRAQQSSGNLGDGQAPRWQEGPDRPEQSGSQLAYSDSAELRLEQGRSCGEGGAGPAESGDSRQILANPQGEGSQARCCGPEESCRPLDPWSFWPPGQDPELWVDISRDRWPAAPQYDLRRGVDGIPPWVVESNRYRVDRLRCLGNAVSPPVAAVAWSVLVGRAMR